MCIYIYIYIYIFFFLFFFFCYLGQAWPFEVILPGPSLFSKCVYQKHYKIGFLHTFRRAAAAQCKLRCYYLGRVGHLYVATNVDQIIAPTWPR